MCVCVYIYIYIYSNFFFRCRYFSTLNKNMTCWETSWNDFKLNKLNWTKMRNVEMELYIYIFFLSAENNVYVLVLVHHTQRLLLLYMLFTSSQVSLFGSRMAASFPSPAMWKPSSVANTSRRVLFPQPISFCMGNTWEGWDKPFRIRLIGHENTWLDWKLKLDNFAHAMT